MTPFMMKIIPMREHMISAELLGLAIRKTPSAQNTQDITIYPFLAIFKVLSESMSIPLSIFCGVL